MGCSGETFARVLFRAERILSCAAAVLNEESSTRIVASFGVRAMPETNG